MDTTIVHTVDDFLNKQGECLGVSNWQLVNQEMINKFADATLDHQWIHVDSVRAAKESPYNSTIAHGYLTLSLIPHFLDEILEVHNLDKLVNYGIEKLTYKAIVPVDSRLRLRATLKSVKDLGTICKANILCQMEMDGCEEPVMEGVINFLYYFKENV